MNRDLAKKRGLHLLAAAFAIFYVFVSLFPLLFSLLSSFKNNTTIYAAPFALRLIWKTTAMRLAAHRCCAAWQTRFYIPCCPSR